MCAQIMLTGKVIVLGEGVSDVLDFGFTNMVDLSKNAKEKWKAALPRPKYEDLKQWHEKYSRRASPTAICALWLLMWQQVYQG